MEFHAQWNVTSAIRIAHALEPYRPMWLEDMLMPGNYLQYHELAAATSLPLIAGERMAGKLQFEQLLESRTVKYVMFDVTWCGGLTEARKIAAHGGRIRAAHRAAHGRRAPAVLRQHASFHCIAQRVDTGELPAVLRARLAGHAGESHRAGGRIYTRARGKRVWDADQTGSLESSRGRPAG